MHNIYFKTVIFLLIIFVLCSCQKKKEISNLVTFDVGFNGLKSSQGICNNNGEEEVYFYRTRFNPCVKFYDLEGNLKDSLSLQQVDSQIGHLGLFYTTSKDTIIIDTGEIVAGLKRDGSLLFKINMDSLSIQTEKDGYYFFGNLLPASIYTSDNIILSLVWNSKHGGYPNDSYSDCVKYLFEKRMHSPILCKLESVYSNTPKMKYAFRDYFYNKSHEIKAYGINGINYTILNNKIFFITAYDRNIYELDINTFNITDTILIIPKEYEIPTGIKWIDNPNVSNDDMAMQEVQDKCVITNMLYSNTKKQYYVFLRTEKDLSAIDELGYPFKLYVYDESFTKKKEYPFDTDLYNPKTAMMTSKGIMIEKTIKNQEYGKRTFEFLDL